jgi:cytoskeletal protein CcmA (bactofilin family)
LLTVKESEITFEVQESPEGGYEARAVGHSIFTQADSIDELHEMVRDAVRCHFESHAIPDEIRLHFLEAKTQASSAPAIIGASLTLRGELSGNQDLILDGEVQGTITLPGRSLTIGPNARVRADLKAEMVVVSGKVEGNISAGAVELKRTASVYGDILTTRISIEDGAYFKGGIEIIRKESPSRLETHEFVADQVIAT